MRRRTILLAIHLLLASQITMADNWQFKKELKSDVFIFGETTITRIIDTGENRSDPEYKIKVVVKGKDVALFNNLTFSAISVFDKVKYFLAVSLTA